MRELRFPDTEQGTLLSKENSCVLNSSSVFHFLCLTVELLQSFPAKRLKKKVSV